MMRAHGVIFCHPEYSNEGANMRCRALGVLAAGWLLAVIANASPLSYDESIDGDIPGEGPLKTLALDYGVNTVAGTMHVSTSAGSASMDLDPFFATMPGGARLRSARVDIDYHDTTGNTAVYDLFWELGPHLNPTAQACFGLETATVLCSESESAGGTIFTGFALGEPFFSVLPSSVTSAVDFAFPYGGQFSYSLQLEVLGIPEPSTVSLLGLGLLGAMVGQRAARRVTRDA
jgi:hypothetical protein